MRLFERATRLPSGEPPLPSAAASARLCASSDRVALPLVLYWTRICLSLIHI